MVGDDVIVVIVGVVDDGEFEFLNPEDLEASSKSNWVSNAQSSPRMASNSKSPDSVIFKISKIQICENNYFMKLLRIWG